MLIRLGYELAYEFAQATPMILNLSVHYSRSVAEPPFPYMASLRSAQ